MSLKERRAKMIYGFSGVYTVYAADEIRNVRGSGVDIAICEERSYGR